MRALAKLILEIIWQYVISVLSEEDIKQILKESITDYLEKTLDPNELLDEGKDAIKWLRERF